MHSSEAKRILCWILLTCFGMLPNLSLSAADRAESVVNLGPDRTICPGDSALLLPLPGGFASYLWSTGATTPTLWVKTPGQYYVDVDDGMGCTGADTINIFMYPALSGDIGNDTTLCGGGILQLDAGSWGGASYTWQPGPIVSQTYLVGNPGQYTVTINDGNGCLFYDTINVAFDQAPVVSLTASTGAICQGEPVTFTANPSGLDQYIFEDNGNVMQAGPNISWTTTGLLPGNLVSVTGVTAGGCSTFVSNSVMVTIMSKPAASANVTTVCAGTPTTFTATTTPGNSLTWSGQGGLSGSGPIVNYTYPAAGIYSWTLTVNNGSCDSLITGIVLVESVPAAPTVADTLLCKGEDALLLATAPGGSYTWFDAAIGGNIVGTTDNLFVPAPPNTVSYFVETMVGNCSSSRTQVTVGVSFPPAASFNAAPGVSEILYIPESFVQFNNNSLGAATYQWDFGDGNTSTEFAPLHEYPESGLYTVTLIARNADGCADTTSLSAFEVKQRPPVFMPNAFSPNGDGLNDLYKFLTPGYASNEFQVYDRWGQLIFSNNGLPDKFWDGTIRGKAAPEGAYPYVLVLIERSGEEIVSFGSITLIR